MSAAVLIPCGPKEGVRYPLQVVYVPICDGWPVEYCEYHPSHEKPEYREWLAENLNEEMKALYLGVGEDAVEDDGAGGEGEGEEKSKRQKRGGKGKIKAKKPAASEKQVVKLSRASRGKKKFVTVVTGLGSHGVDLKTASKFFSSRFACSSSVTGDDEIVIQGDVKDDLWDVICEKWSDIDEDDIDDLGDMKR